MKNVYVVTGSEDGCLGVYGSVAKALARATQYLTQNEPAKLITHFLAEDKMSCIKVPADLKHIRMKMKNVASADIEKEGVSDRVSCRIEEFGLNQ